MKFACHFVVLVLCSSIKSSIQLSSGAPGTACATLLPSHRGIQPQTTEPPYTITASVLPSRNINVKIKAIGIEGFAGFLIQGRQAGNNIPLGQFNVPVGVTNYQTATCVTNADSATHTSSTVKTELDIIWIPPVGFNGQIYFTGVVLHEFSVFWGEIKSVPIEFTDTSDEIYGKCDGTRNCYGAPTGCLETRNCDAIAVVHMNNDIFQFELKTGPSTTTFQPQYIALGISDGRSMANISVIDCEVGQNGLIGMYASYTEVLATGRGSPRTDIPQNIIRLIDSSYIDGRIYCMIERDTVSTVHNHVYNLLTDKFYVHLVVGSALRENEVGFHNLALSRSDERDLIYYIERSTDPIYDSCNGSTVCFGAPLGCVNRRNCDAIAVVHMNNDIFQFELKTGPSTTTFQPQYIALGISDGRSMANISVIDCEVGQNGLIGMYASYTEVLATGRGSPRTDIPQNIIRLIDSSYIDGRIYCMIERDTVSTVHNHVYNLLTDEFYVHLVVGSALHENEVGFHNLALSRSDERDLIYYIERSTDPIYDSCNGSTVCFGAPLGCVNRRNCEAIAVVHHTNDKFQIELKTLRVLVAQPPAYIAFGISDHLSMADISVVECTVENSIIHEYISQTEVTETSRNSPRTDISQDVVRLIQSTYVDGAIHCRVERDTVTDIRGRIYDLLNEQFYIHVAVGTGLRENSVSVHNLNRVTSPEKLSLYQKPIEANSIYDGCGVTKGCFGHPTDCVDTFDCLTVTTINFANNLFQFEMMADTRSGAPRYVAFGLSESTGMGDASVIECVVENNAIQAYTSYTKTSPYGASRNDISQNIIRLVSGTYEDGQIHCVVERDTISEVRGKTYDLMNDEYHLLIASGTSVGENSVEQHNRGRLISGTRQSLRDLTFGSASSASIKVHGIFMIVAWVGTSTIGIVLARYFKKTWVGNQMCGQDQWFAWHRICMICTGLLTITAFIVIFVEIDGWSAENNPHAILGTIVTGICLFQILGAMFRPAPDAKHRVYFNRGHMLGGSVGQILAVITIFFAVTLTKAELTDEFYWVMGGFCVFYIIIYTLFHIMLLVSDKQNHYVDDGDAPFSVVRKIMLGIFITVTLLFVVALSVLIGLAPL